MCFCLANPNSGWAAAASQNPVNGLSSILQMHRDIKTGIGNIDLINKKGPRLADITFAFLKDPKNKSFLSSAEGIELRKHQTLLTNYLAVKKHLEKCIKEKNNSRNLGDRILQSSYQSLSNIGEVSVPCLPETTKMAANFLEFNNTVMKSMKKMVNPHFQNELSQQILSNAAKSILAFKVKFKPDFMKKGYLTQDELDEVVKEICEKRIRVATGMYTTKDVCKKMSPHFVPKLAKNLIAFSKTVDAKVKFTPEKAAASLNSAIDRINNSLNKIKVKKDVGIIYDSADLNDDPAAKAAYDQYVNQYASEVSKDAGALLLTSTIKDEAGSLRNFKKDDTTKDKKTTEFKFVQHEKITLKEVKKSIKEVETKMQAQVDDTLDIMMNSTKKPGVLSSDVDDIADLVKINPFAAGQLLAHSPEYAGLMCDSINKISEDDSDKATRDKYVAAGSMAIGLALIATGVGVFATATLVPYVLTGTASLSSVAAGTAGGTAIGYIAIAGSANELVSLSYNTNKAYNYLQEVQNLESAYLNQNADGQALSRARDALVEFKEARLDAVQSLASLGFNIATTGTFFNLLKASGKKALKPAELLAGTQIMKHISQTAVARKLKDVSNIMGNKSGDKLDKFLLNLAQVGENNRIKFLNFLSNSKIVPEQVKQVIDEALEALRVCERL